jgi:sugar phosphate isomerase/epimerase
MVSMDRIGCSTITFRMLPLEGALGQIAQRGLSTIDLGVISRFCPHIDPLTISDLELDQLAQKLQGLGLRVSSLNAWSLTHLNDADGLETELPFLRASIRAASRLGARVLSVQPGRKVAEEYWAEAADQVAQVLQALGQEAQELGLQLAIEAPHKGTLAERFEDACRMIEMLDPSLLGVVLDSSHVLNAGATIELALKRYGPRVCHVHLRDFRQGSILVTPGDGEVDFHELFTGLARLGYLGEFNLELEYQGYSAQQVATELSRALDYLRKEPSHGQ